MLSVSLLFEVTDDGNLAASMRQRKKHLSNLFHQNHPSTLKFSGANIEPWCPSSHTVNKRKNSTATPASHRKSQNNLAKTTPNATKDLIWFLPHVYGKIEGSCECVIV